MTCWFDSVGVLRASYSDGLYRLALEVDPGIVDVARALVPKHIRLARQRYAPHISVVREENPGPLSLEGLKVPFTYCPEVVPGEVYYWLRAESPELRVLRASLGLPLMAWYNYPPDLEDCFHITVGNTKGA